MTAISLLPWQQWRRTTTNSSFPVQLRKFATTKDPSRSKTDEKQRSAAESFKSHSTINSNRKVTQRKSKGLPHDLKTSNEMARQNIKLDDVSQYSHSTPPRAIPVMQPSIYYYCSSPPAKPAGIPEKKTNSSSRSSNRFVLQAMNASAFLDPLKYCKTSSRLSSNRSGVSRSISGTDAARRLLRGKKDFILAARSLKNQPALLEGHGVPPKLFQHCIDMADALLLQYSPDAVECTFHNYNSVLGQSKLPRVLRIRSRDTTNRCGSWPPPNSLVGDWNYHLELYLTVMERMACHLGMVLQKKQVHPLKVDDIEKYGEKGDDGDELTSSPFLFPNSNIPQWNVEILRGFYFDLQKDGPEGTSSNSIPPLPIVEFRKESENTGHVLIRLQGYSAENIEFGAQRSNQAVTLVFDACFRHERN